MFTDSLSTKLLSSSKSLKILHNPEDDKTFDLSDLQFQLCSNFLKQTKQKLYYQEAQLLSSCSKFISQVQQKNLSLKDISATQDTTTFSLQSVDEDDLFSQSCKSMLILRKSKSSTCVRRTQINFTSILRELQGRCTQKSYQAIVNLIDENKKLKQRVSNIQKNIRQKQIKKRQVDYEKQQEQMFLLKKKISQKDKLVNDLNIQIATLNNKLKQIQQPKKLKSSNQIAVPMLMQVQASLKLFLHQKQMIINQSSKKLKDLHHQVQTRIQQPFNTSPQKCQKCCIMLRKVKGSIMKYRQLMQEEAEAVQSLFQKFKTKLK